ncbi:MAG: PcfK-like family protein [Muribaculaceae bacterium]|nr:PcfK-like family protein [Muribaculaceae bacterium]
MAANNNNAKEVIKDYLDKRAASDPQFAKAYAKPAKNIDECFKYILCEASKRGATVCMTNDEVFGLAVHYYDEDGLKVGTPPRLAHARATKEATAPSVELTAREKAKARAEAIEEFKRQCMVDEVQKECERHKLKAEKKKKAAPAKVEHIQPALFDFDDLCDQETN